MNNDFECSDLSENSSGGGKRRRCEATVVQACVSELKAVPVIRHPDRHLGGHYVVEIDVTPAYLVCKGLVFTVKLADGGSETFFRDGTSNRRKKDINKTGRHCLNQRVRYELLEM